MSSPCSQNACWHDDEASIAGTAEAAIPVSDADPRKAGLGYTDAAPLGIWTRL